VTVGEPKQLGDGGQHRSGRAVLGAVHTGRDAGRSLMQLRPDVAERQLHRLVVHAGCVRADDGGLTMLTEH
jgi:hypothetical protein